MTNEELRAAAEQAIADYNEAYANGGELDYPHWADDVLADEVTEGETNG